MRLAVTGSRTWVDAALIHRTLDAINPRPTILIHGGAEGVDNIAAEWARRNHIHRACVRPGNPKDKASYLDRNSEIVAMADFVVAFRMPGKSNGTDYTVRCAEASGKMLMPVVTP